MRTFLILLNDGTENEITAMSLMSASEHAERDHGSNNIMAIIDTTPLFAAPTGSIYEQFVDKLTDKMMKSLYLKVGEPLEDMINLDKVK